MRLPLLAGALCALLLAACGGSASPPPAPVRLAVSAPADLGAVRAASVEVRGTVRPADATVTVAGRHAAVSGHGFRVRVALDAGVNVIDVAASAGRARPALTAIRVRRILTVTIPDVLGLDPDAARTQLQDRGLRVDTQQDPGGGFLDQLLGRQPQVCLTDPPPGEQVDEGTTVHVTVGRQC
jgi:hypothetical protein